MEDCQSNRSAEKMKAILYRLTFPNNKSYIGITTKTLERRCRGHIQGANGNNKTAIACAIRKYKLFKKEILLSGPLYKIKEMEIHFIRELNTLSPNGYNLSLGGDTSPLMNPATAAKLKGNKFAVNKTGVKRKFTEDHLRRLSESMRGNKNCLDKHWGFGNKNASGKRTPEQCERIKEGVRLAKIRKEKQ